MTCSSCREDSAAFACLQQTTACMRLFLFLCFPAASAVDVIPSLEIRMDSANQHSPTPACVRIAGQQASTIITTTAHRVAARFSNGLGGALLERVVLHLLSTTTLYSTRTRHLLRHGCLGVVGGCVRSRVPSSESVHKTRVVACLVYHRHHSVACGVLVSYYIPRITHYH